MKTIFQKLFFLFFLLTTFLHSQDWIKDYEYIPLVSPSLWWGWVEHYPNFVTEMKNVGVDVVRLEIANTDSMQRLASLGFRVIPVRTLGLNYIQYYTDAKYSIWEAEGTPPNFGDATLEHDPAKATPNNDGTREFLKLLPDSANKTFEMINGPFYIQDVNYYTHQSNNEDTLVNYRADYEMKLEWNRLVADTNFAFNPTTPICRLQVTQSYALTTQTLGCTYPIVDTVLMLSDLQPLNIWKNFSFDYTLVCDSCTRKPDTTQQPPEQYHNFVTDGSLEAPSLNRFAREYIQFKVIWLGNPNFLLSVDKVTISDQRGRELFVVQDSLIYRGLITQQTNQLSSYNENVAGWLGVDEPVSIDIFKPIKLITQILDDNSDQVRPLWLPWMGKWAGSWNQPENIFGAMGLSPWTEFKKRVGKGNIIQDFYMYDYPFRIDHNPLNVPDWKDENIRIIAELNYKQASELDPFWGASIQTGECYNGQAYQRNVHRHEVLYNANLALMYGAKFIELWPYFASRSTSDSASGLSINGIVYFNDFYGEGPLHSDKFYMLRDTLNPRLKGLFGKTIKQLEPDSSKVLGKDILIDPDFSGFYSYIDFIEAEGRQTDTCIVDLGLFTDPEDYSSRYFMTINRYYSTFGNMTFGLKDLSTYKNWQITDLMDTSGVSLVAYNNKVEFNDTIIPGDAKLYNILPVIRKGGTIAENDTVFYNTILSDNMTIDAGKVLQINEGKTYTITDTITFADTSSFITGYGYINLTQNGWITTRSWNRSLFKGRSGSHPKLIWSKHPVITNVIDYKIYRNHANGGWQYLTTKSSSLFEYIDSTITIIEGMSQANETSTQYRITATHRPTRDIVETSPTNTILYHRVEGQGLEKQNSGLTSNVFTYNLDQNYPNPFNPTTTINYSIEDDGIVTLDIMNILGERIKTLVNEFKTKGNHNISFDASSLASGVYVYKLQTGDFIKSKKMILLK